MDTFDRMIESETHKFLVRTLDDPEDFIQNIHRSILQLSFVHRFYLTRSQDGWCYNSTSDIRI